MFLFRHRRHGSSCFKLLALLLGFGFLVRHHRDHKCEHTEAEREEMRAKARTFRSKLREAFGVWTEKPAEPTSNDTTVTE